MDGCEKNPWPLCTFGCGLLGAACFGLCGL
jgi:hypothetical protein